MNNPWSKLPTAAPFVLPQDLQVLNDLNAKLPPNDPRRYELNTVLPEPFIGSVQTAKVLVLQLNPGFDPISDPEVHAQPDFSQALLDNLQHRNTEYPFFFFDPRFIKTPGGIWWKDKTKVLCNEVPLKVLSKNIAVVEWFPYKSDKFKYPGKRKRVASQEYSFNLVSEAMDRGALIIISRSVKLWEESVPELQNYNRKLTLSSAQNVVITPNNLLLNREKTTAAWEMLLEAVNS